MLNPTEKTKFTVYEGVYPSNVGQQHFSTYDPKVSPEDAVKGYTGEIWYKIIGYADSVADAQTMIFGRPCPLS